MYDWISQLKPGQRVLDVGSGPGSFPNSAFACSVVALDEDVDAFQSAAPLGDGPYYRVFGQSDHMPFAPASFDLVICHHALEHVIKLQETLAEIARVLKPDGRCYVAVPNGYGLCDGIYRFVFEGGGHVNRFTHREVISLIERSVNVRLVRWQKLYSSFAYLRRLMELLAAPPPDLSKRLLAIGRLPRRSLGAAQRLLYSGARVLDRIFHTDLAIYGWAFYFERSDGAPVQEPAYLNVCLYCGAGHPAASLERISRSRYRCGACNRVNPYFAPFAGTL
jgi:SAM-dependent methyltransferase